MPPLSSLFLSLAGSSAQSNLSCRLDESAQSSLLSLMLGTSTRPHEHKRKSKETKNPIKEEGERPERGERGQSQQGRAQDGLCQS